MIIAIYGMVDAKLQIKLQKSSPMGDEFGKIATSWAESLSANAVSQIRLIKQGGTSYASSSDCCILACSSFKINTVISGMG